MVVSPHHIFSREYNANFVITDEGRDALHENISVNHTTGEARDALHRFNSHSQGFAWSFDDFHIYTGGFLGGFDNNIAYGGCRDCYNYSMLFGGGHTCLGFIDNEEDFEKFKEGFVKHYNEKHRDLYEWRMGGKKGEKPITKKVPEDITAVPRRTVHTIDENGYHVENFYGIDIVTSQEPRAERRGWRDQPRRAFGRSMFHRLHQAQPRLR